MLMTTLCYIEKEGQYLMLHRTKKENDLNHDLWIGVGGKFQGEESPDECLLREVNEETGLTLTNYQFRGLITFISDEWESEYMCLYTANEFQGEIAECNEGELEWVDMDKIFDLDLWEGDKIFLQRMMESDTFFSLKLRYEGRKLVQAVMDGRDVLQ